MNRTPDQPSTFAARLARARRDTGLSNAQLGVARVYDNPHSYDFLRSHPDLPLGGEEVLIKDLQQVAGEVTTMGSVHHSFVANYHDTTAHRLLVGGATLVGASSSAEYGTTAYTEPVGMSQPVNPLNSAMMVGGSSGGAATAVARGLVNIAHATDGGGSIRIPAACCGLAALKPTHNHRFGSFTPVAQGFIASDLPTTARAYGLPAPDTDTLHLEPAHPPQPLRIGYTNQPFHTRSVVSPDIAAATAAATALATTHPLVESVTQAPAPYPPATFQLFRDLIAARCADLPGTLSPITSWLREEGRQVPKWRRQQLEEQIVGLDPQRAWPHFDVIATPTLACTPPPPGAFSQLTPADNFWAQTAWTPWGTLWNLTGWAAVTLPLVAPERVPGRWPIALMLGAVGNRTNAATLLSLAAFLMDAASRLPAESLSVAVPGDIEALDFRAKPDNSHSHNHSHNSHEH
ncbi:amidase family protein [Corynebacterium evansiae]